MKSKAANLNLENDEKGNFDSQILFLEKVLNRFGIKAQDGIFLKHFIILARFVDALFNFFFITYNLNL